MPSVLDVAAYILQQMGSMSTWKLQKLVYYCQSWSLLWDDDVIFPEEIEAWANGPVVRELYNVHENQYRIRSEDIENGDSDNLSAVQKETVDVVLKDYGDKSNQWLSDLIHMEDPWKNSRKGMPVGERGNTVIPKQDLAEYYGSLDSRHPFVKS